MITSTPPEKTSETTKEETSASPEESIIEHTELPDQPDSAVKRLVSFFKRPAAATPEAASEPEPVPDSVPPAPAPVRASGQGLRRKPKASRKNPDPDMRLRAFMAPPMSNEPEKTSAMVNLRPTKDKTRKAYWDVAGAFSLVVNAILIAVLVIMAGQIKNLKTMMNGLLGGLYSNFVQLDKANISTTIPVNAQIPVVFSLPVKQNTAVTLTSDVTIAHTGVIINSGGLSINAPATITLPAGTNLPIALDLDIPVQLTIPISLQIPVNIPMNQTMLHNPFTGLQQTIKPLYCIINKNAQYPQGIYICNTQNSPNVGNP